VTYDDSLSTNKDIVRWRLGDTSNDASTELQTDNEVWGALALSNDNVSRAELACARAIRGTFARQVSTSVGDVRVEAQQQYEHYDRLVKTLERESGRAAIAAPWMGGVSIDDKQGYEGDTDRVQPAFSRSTGGVLPGTNETLDQDQT